MAAAPASEEGIREGLALIRLRQRRMGHLLLGFVPFVLVAAYNSHQPFDVETPFILAALAYGAVLLAYSFRLAFTECPKCHGFFHCRTWLDPLAKECLHCRLPLEGSERIGDRSGHT